MPGVSEIIVRDSNGDFGGRTVDVSNIKIDTQLAIDSAVTATGGYLRYYGYNNAGGILISEGSLAADDKTSYWNDSHEFKTQNGVSNAPITAVGAITSTGALVIAGSLTGVTTISASSTITCTGIQAQTLTTGGNTTAGSITGRWTLTGTSGPTVDDIVADIKDIGIKDYELKIYYYFYYQIQYPPLHHHPIYHKNSFQFYVVQIPP